MNIHITQTDKGWAWVVNEETTTYSYHNGWDYDEKVIKEGVCDTFIQASVATMRAVREYDELQEKLLKQEQDYWDQQTALDSLDQHINHQSEAF